MKVIKKCILSCEESNLFGKFYELLGKLKDNLKNEDMDELWDEIDQLETQVSDVWGNFDEE